MDKKDLFEKLSDMKATLDLLNHKDAFSNPAAEEIFKVVWADLVAILSELE